MSSRDPGREPQTRWKGRPFSHAERIVRCPQDEQIGEKKRIALLLLLAYLQAENEELSDNRKLCTMSYCS